jgi:hypothetical protein
MASHCRLWDYSISSYIEVQPRRLGIYGALDVVELESFRKTPWQMIKQVASPKIALPYNYHAHMASSGWWPDQGQTLTHFEDHLKSTVICQWTPLQERHTNINTSEPHHIYNYIRLAAKLWPILESLDLFPHGRANKLKTMISHSTFYSL